MMLMLAAFALAHAHVPEVFITNSGEDWCGVIESVAGGDYVMLEPGDYLGPCDFVSKVSDPPGEVTIVQSLDPNNPARILHDGATPYMLSVEGEFGLLLGLDFGVVPEGVVAVELRDGLDLGVRNARFSGEGSGIRQVGTIGNVSVRDCVFDEATGAGLDVGCAGACPPEAVEVSNNLIDGGSVSLVVHAERVDVFDNVAVGVQGTLLQIVGDEGEVVRNTFEATVPLDVAGPLVVGSNQVFGDLQVSGGQVVGNTIVGSVQGSPGVVAHNAVVGAAGPDDVACDASCFVDLDGRELYPAQDGPLVAAAPGLELATDWCGRERSSTPSAGAFEFVGDASPGPVELTYRTRVDCRLPDTDTGPSTNTGDTATSAPPDGSEEAGCGCAASSGPVALSWLSRRRPASVR